MAIPQIARPVCTNCIKLLRPGCVRPVVVDLVFYQTHIRRDLSIAHNARLLDAFCVSSHLPTITALLSSDGLVSIP